MSCKVLSLPGGGHAIVCGPKDRPKTCSVCGRQTREPDLCAFPPVATAKQTCSVGPLVPVVRPRVGVEAQRGVCIVHRGGGPAGAPRGGALDRTRNCCCPLVLERGARRYRGHRLVSRRGREAIGDACGFSSGRLK